MDVLIKYLEPKQVSNQFVELLEVYEAMYDLDPGSGEVFGPLLSEHSQREGFQFHAAIDRDTGRVVGFAYRFTGRPGQTWRDRLAEVVGPKMATEWLSGHFEFAEFGVTPANRRCGIGVQLDELDWPHRRCRTLHYVKRRATVHFPPVAPANPRSSLWKHCC